MRLPFFLYISGLLISLIGASLLPDKPQYQFNSLNTDAENAAGQAKIDREYTSTVLGSTQFKLIVSGIVIIFITIPYHIWLRRAVKPLPLALVEAKPPPLEAKPLKSALRSANIVAPDVKPTLIVKPPTPPKYAGPVIRYFRINHAPLS